MSSEHYQELLLRVFSQLRQRDFNLGVSELLAALQLLDGNWSFDGLDELRIDIQRLWCHSWASEHAFNEIWDEEERLREEPKRPLLSPDTSAVPEKGSSKTEPPTPYQHPPEELVTPPQRDATVSFLPVRLPKLPEMRSEMAPHWPLSRRMMAYGWQYMRRTRADGAATLMDLESTIKHIARQGYFVAPVYRRQLRHHAHLLLLIDRRGSMVPFHQLTRDLIETAQQAPTLEQVESFYFHDVATNTLYIDPLLNDPVDFRRGLDSCGTETSVLVVSDAGAARGSLDTDRILSTLEMLAGLRKYTALVSWLNPMPPSRWAGTSAQVISHLVPTFPLDTNGFIDAIKSVRGRPSKKPSLNP